MYVMFEFQCLILHWFKSQNHCEHFKVQIGEVWMEQVEHEALIATLTMKGGYSNPKTGSKIPSGGTMGNGIF